MHSRLLDAMSMPRIRIVLASAALTAGLAGTVVAAQPAAAVASQQCKPSHTCMNFWGGGFAVRSYQGSAENNHMWIHWLGNGTFELRDAIHPGTCVGDYNGARGTAAMGGGNVCPSSGTGDWGTVFSLVADNICPLGYVKIWSGHWLAYVGFADGNNHPVSENTSGSCIYPET